jgi:transposase
MLACRQEADVGRTGMSSRELQRVEVLARVQGRALQLKEAAEILAVSYRQAKRLWRRYRQQGAAGLQHGSAGRAAHRATPERLRERVLQLVRQKYSGAPGERFGPTLAAEHLEIEDGIRVDAETLRCWMLGAGCRVGYASVKGIVNNASASSISGRWCNWTAAFTPGWRSAGRPGA